MKVYRESDADLSALSARTVAIVGYGNQGRAHALNLRDSGVRVDVAIGPGRPSWARATDDGFAPRTVADAVQGADLVAILLPDEVQAAYVRDNDSVRGFGRGL